MIRIFAFTVSMFALAAFSPASAQGVLEDCEPDIASYCDQVEPGEGRVIACLYAHEDNISDACYAATVDFGDVLDYLFAGIREATAVCAADISNHCGGTEFGHGRILSCLAEHRPEVSAECGPVVDGFADAMAAAE